ncbi:MAG TPA: hypothetical protein VH372_09975 [Actinospica sp.]|jgi:hypothetical protein|nr:hypothetical protein [Actinospica sp.]
MRFCPDCGTGHECEGTATALDREVEIERLRTKRDIEVARITASAARDIAETDAENSSEHAEGVAEGMETALEAVSGGGAPEGEGGAPVVVDMPDEAEAEAEPEPDMEPPVVDIAPAMDAKRGGYWDAYK